MPRVPWIIDYSNVLQTLHEQRFRCNYYNSGSFAFAAPAEPTVVGWIGPEDSTIRPDVLPLTTTVAAPYEPTLAKLAARVWSEKLPGRAWIMPTSHWAYELDHGSREWMPSMLENLSLDPGLLVDRANAAAIEFSPAELPQFTRFVERLLEMLNNSDFAIVFPGHAALCTIHHHKQLWWQTTDADLAAHLRAATNMSEPAV